MMRQRMILATAGSYNRTYVELKFGKEMVGQAEQVAVIIVLM